jgi:hypothetical protein
MRYRQFDNMNISLKVLGLIAMLASPFLWIERYFYEHALDNTSLTGACDLIYMIGWSCSIVGLIKLMAAGDNRWGKTILLIQLGCLCIANIWNIWVIIDPLNQSTIFNILDKFWPISNCFMLITGIAVIVSKKISGFFRFVPLIAGLWLPVTVVSSMLLKGDQLFYVMNGYSFCSFFLLGLMIFRQALVKNEALAVEIKHTDLI